MLLPVTFTCYITQERKFQGLLLVVDSNERPYCRGPSLWCIHHDAHRMDNALRVLRVLLDVAAQAAGDLLRGGHHQSLLGMVLLDQHSGRYE